MERKLKHGMALLLLAATLTAAGCGGAQTTQKQEGGGAAQPSAEQSAKVKVVTSFYPLYYFASKVGGDRVSVTSLVSSGVEPHDWEPTAQDMKTLNGAQVFVYNGAGFEPWAKKTLESLDNKKLITVDSSQGIALLEGEDHDEHGHEAHDPHIWLDPVHNLHQVKLITEALVKADPAGKATYEANAKALNEKLQTLDKEYQTLASCKRKEIVISHAFFAYPAKRYGLKQMPVIAGLAPDVEPTAKEMAGLVKFVKEHKVQYIFTETLVNEKVGKTIAAETGAKTLVLNPIEGLTKAEEVQGKDFLALSQANLANLKVALDCTR